MTTTCVSNAHANHAHPLIDFTKDYTVRSDHLTFELFPPKDVNAAPRFWSAVTALSALNPEYLSVTCGADGSAHERTLKTIESLVARTSVAIAPHVTCVSSERGRIREQAEHYWSLGIRHVVALRGDEPKVTSTPTARHERVKDVFELIDTFRRVGDFDIAVAAYPETHPKALSPEQDLDHLARKIDHGATRAITQFFFDHNRFSDFLEASARRQLSQHIVPGILCIKQFAQTERFATQCGARIPSWLRQRFDAQTAHDDADKLIAAQVALDQMRALCASGFERFHLYTLNDASLPLAVCRSLGVHPSNASHKGCAA